MDKLRCEYCGCTFDVLLPSCPDCGAPNDEFLRREKDVPKTIEQLQQYCAARRVDLPKLRFFIGEDYQQPQAYGIFREADGNFLVYKNHSDGSREICYRGPNEAYAVDLLFGKLRKAMLSHHHHHHSDDSSSRARDHLHDPTSVIGRRHRSKMRIITILVATALLFALGFGTILYASLH